MMSDSMHADSEEGDMATARMAARVERMLWPWLGGSVSDGVWLHGPLVG